MPKISSLYHPKWPILRPQQKLFQRGALKYKTLLTKLKTRFLQICEQLKHICSKCLAYEQTRTTFHSHEYFTQASVSIKSATWDKIEIWLGS